MEIFKRVLAQNKDWAERKIQETPHYFEELAKGQSPEFLYIGCADSRVPAAQIMGLEPGGAFVHRNIANVVNTNDNNVNAVIQYAVQHLKVPHVIICGHYGCGGIKAALQHQDMGQLNSWLTGLRDVYRLHQKELDSLQDGEAKENRMVELNVEEQCINFLKLDHVQKAMRDRQSPQVHGVVFDLSSGLLKDLNIGELPQVKKLQKLYEIA